MSVRILDCSDIDQYLGKPIDSSPIREPIANNDIRRWVHAMHYPNLLHYDPDYAAASRWGKLVAPQSFPIAVDDGQVRGADLFSARRQLLSQSTRGVARQAALHGDPLRS
jgi:hypothetical protein